VTPERVCKPGDVRVLMYRARRRPLHVVLRRPASVVRRQRREGDGRGQAGLSGADAGDDEALPPARAHAGGDPRRSQPGLRARVVRVDRLTPTIIEVVVRRRPPRATSSPASSTACRTTRRARCAPRARCSPWRASRSPAPGSTRSAACCRSIALEMGGSSDLCALLKPGEPVIVMGPTGAPTEIEPGETVVLVGGGLGNAVLFSIGQAFRKAGSKVLYFAGYKKHGRPLQGRGDRGGGRRRRLVLRRGAGLRAGPAAGQVGRRQHRRGDALYASGELGDQPIPYSAADRIMAIGSDRHDGAVRLARHGAEAVPEARAPADRLDQLADAVHDEGDLRPVPAAAPGSGDRQGDGGVFLLQPGPAARPGRFLWIDRSLRRLGVRD
jgi:hypothetical protein